MRSMKRINAFEGIPTHYVVYEDMDIVGIYKTKQEAEKAMED